MSSEAMTGISATALGVASLVRKLKEGINMNGSQRFYLLLALLLCLFTLALLPSSVSGEAQSTVWPPTRVDLTDSGFIRVVGLEKDTVATVSSSVEAHVAEPEKSIYTRGPARTGQMHSSTTESSYTARQAAGEWITILSDDFEGAFPGEWHVFDSDGDTNGEYLWAKRDCRPYTGGYSAWAVGGGADGSALSCGSHYPDHAQSWMIYGPFSLEDATEAELRFMYWLNSERGNDHLFVGASIGGPFYGVRTSGTRDWALHTLDLTDVFTLGDLTGEDQVRVAFYFFSDESTTLPEGAYVDQVILRKYVGAEGKHYAHLPLVLRNFWTGFFDDFSDPNSGWGSGEYPSVIYRYLGGEYQLYLKREQSGFGVTPDLVLPSDYRIEVDARRVSSGVCSYGLLFGTRGTGDSLETYQVIVWPTGGEYLVNKRTLHGSWTIIRDWTYSSAINQNYGTNRIGVDRVGTTIRIYVNGTLVANITDSSLTGPGRDAGIVAYSYEDAPVDVRFDNFSASLP